MKGKFLLILFIVSALLLSPVSFADEEEEYMEFLPSDVIYKYNDHNSTTYEGDSGLIMGYVNNSLDGKLYNVATEYLRGMAYVSNGTFKFDEPILVLVSSTSYDDHNTAYRPKFKNGTEIPYLGIDSNDLTNEQKKYFDDYDTQRSEYLMQQQQYAQEDLYDYYTVRDRSNSKSKYSYYFGSGGSGVIYTPGSSSW